MPDVGIKTCFSLTADAAGHIRDQSASSRLQSNRAGASRNTDSDSLSACQNNDTPCTIILQLAKRSLRVSCLRVDSGDAELAAVFEGGG